MAILSYRKPGFVIGPESPASRAQITDLQRDLRRLGYLRRGIDGSYGQNTRRAVQALQHDLLHNSGKSSAGDGDAPVRIAGYNRGRVTAANGIADQGLVECIADILDDPAFPQLPSADDPARENQRIALQIQQLPPKLVPTLFLVAILKQESGLLHYSVPRSDDPDNFIIVGTDASSSVSYAIASRGYGVGQYTLFHHPPRPEEVRDVMLDPARNVEKSARLLRDKFDGFVAGPADRADDRIAERGAGPPVVCKYEPADPRHLRDCRNCVAAAGVRSISPGLPLYPGSASTWKATPVYPAASYTGVPMRERIGCDWPYAMRRYNGGGINSFHYQARVLKHLAAL
jgi:peptidoglycan hydrolase-like protein with peptidoglycan-binding domain